MRKDAGNLLPEENLRRDGSAYDYKMHGGELVHGLLMGLPDDGAVGEKGNYELNATLRNIIGALAGDAE